MVCKLYQLLLVYFFFSLDLTTLRNSLSIAQLGYFLIIVSVQRQFSRQRRHNFDTSGDTISYFTNSGANLLLFSDIRKKKSRILVRTAVLGIGLLSVMCRSSVGGKSVKRVVCGGGIGDSWRRNRRQVVAE